MMSKCPFLKPITLLPLVLIVSSIVLLGYSDANAQKIVPEIKTILHTLPLEKQEWLRDFHERVASYIRSRDWHDNNYGGEIHIEMEFLLQDISSSSEEKYRANLLVSNGEDIQYFDKRCKFKYQHGDQIVQNDQDQLPLTNLIDFYVFLILGGEFDKYGPLEGTPFYEKARDIAQQARYGLGRFVEGWDLRERLIKRHLSEENKPFREMVDYYYYGMSFVGEDDQKAREYCAVAIEMIAEILTADPKHDQCVKFLDAHRRELISLFKGTKQQGVLAKLAKVDPDNAKAYGKSETH